MHFFCLDQSFSTWHNTQPDYFLAQTLDVKYDIDSTPTTYENLTWRETQRSQQTSQGKKGLILRSPRQTDHPTCYENKSSKKLNPKMHVVGITYSVSALFFPWIKLFDLKWLLCFLFFQKAIEPIYLCTLRSCPRPLPLEILTKLSRTKIPIH